MVTVQMETDIIKIAEAMKLERASTVRMLRIILQWALENIGNYIIGDLLDRRNGGYGMVNMNIEITNDAYEEIKSFADFQGESISELLLSAVRERMELWEDIRDIEARKDEPSSPLADVKKRLGIV